MVVAGKAVVALSLVSFIVYGSWWTYEQVISTPRLAVRHLSVSGALRAQPREIIKLAGIEEGQNIFSFSSSEVEKKIGENPWVLEASVKRKLPGTVRILVEERRPVAIVKTKGLFVMDSRGNVFKKFTPADRLDLPIVTGLDGASEEQKRAIIAGFMRLFPILDNRQGFNMGDVSEIHCDYDYGFTIYTLDRGLKLELGNSNFEARLKIFERLMAMNKAVLQGVRAVDLRKAGEAVVRYGHKAVKRGGRI